jgi:hypothetical protein
MGFRATCCHCLDRHAQELRDIVPGVRALAIILVFVSSLGACGGKKPGQGTSGGAAVATVFASAKFVPAQPTYVLSATSMRDAQNSLRDLVDVAGMAGDFEVKDASAMFTYVLGIDPLSPEAVAGIGVDLEGSMVAFSEDTNPTFVVHINAPDAINAYFETQRERGLRTKSVVVAGTEVFTAAISSELAISWAVEGEWLWVHFTIGPPDGTTWFEHSRAPTGTRWVDGWTWAQGLGAAAPALVGFFDVKGLLATVAQHAPGAVECMKQLSAVERVGASFDGDGKHLAARFAFQLGAAADSVAAHLLPPPPGWAAARANAPMAADWNLDVRAAATWIQSCFVKKVSDRPGAMRSEAPDFVGMLDQYGVRTARAFVHTLDPDEKEGTGAVALDLSNARFLRAQLDQIPRRSMFEKSRTFGIYKGTHISVPFVGSGDYVLDDRIAIASMGDGLLARIGSGAAPAGIPPVLAIDLRPPGLPVGVWAFLLAQANAPNPERFAQRLMTWNDLHLGARLEQGSLVIEAAGTRR